MTVTLIAIICAAVFMTAVLTWVLATGKRAGDADAAKEKADALEDEIDRIGRAGTARADAERAARGGLLDDEWTRDE